MTAYDYRFAWESPYGHIVRLLRGRLEAGSIVLDLGCGFGPIAEPIAESDLTYIGCDLSDPGLSSLKDRGFETHRLNLADLGVVVEQIEKIVDGRSLGAILMLDTLEHLPDVEGFLAQLRELCVQFNRPLLGFSIPNVAHFDVGAKLVLGRWDVTPAGLLDRTHLQFFTESRLTAVLEGLGWFEIARDDFQLHHSDQHFPEDSPALADGTPFRDMLWRLRQRIDGNGCVNQFVRLFGLTAAPEIQSREPPEAEPFLSVLIRTQGRRMPNLLEALTCLAAQSESDFEVLLLVHSASDAVVRSVRELVAMFAPEFAFRVGVRAVADGGRARPLNVGLERARGRYLAFLDDDDLVTGDWVGRFKEGAAAAPGRIVRCITADRSVVRSDDHQIRAPYLAVGGLKMSHSERFDPLEHLHQNRTPNCSLAVPLTAVRELNISFDEDLPVLEDWEFLMTLATLCGVHDVGRVTSIYHRWGGAESSLGSVDAEVWDTTRRAILQRLDAGPLLLPSGSASRIASLWHRSLSLPDRETELHEAREQLRNQGSELNHLRSDVRGLRERQEKRLETELGWTQRLEAERLRGELVVLQEQLTEREQALVVLRSESDSIRSSRTWRLMARIRRLTAIVNRRA